MVAAVSLPPAPRRDQRMVVNGVSWKEYVILREDEILAVIEKSEKAAKK